MNENKEVIGEFKLAYQKGGRGYYGFLKLGVLPLLTNEVEVKIFGNLDYHPWRQTIEAASKTAVGLGAHQRTLHGLKVNIIELKDNPIETSENVMMYITVSAIFVALGLDRSGLSFNTNTGEFDCGVFS